VAVDPAGVPVGSNVEITLPKGTVVSDIKAINPITGDPMVIKTKIDPVTGETILVVEGFPGAAGIDPATGKVLIDIGKLTNPITGEPLGPFNIKIIDPTTGEVVQDIKQTIITDPIPPEECD
jgi:hypothetical protein